MKSSELNMSFFLFSTNLLHIYLFISILVIGLFSVEAQQMVCSH